MTNYITLMRATRNPWSGFKLNGPRPYREFETSGTIEAGLYSLMPKAAFFSFCMVAEKKGSGGFPIVFLCSQIYNFWGLLITIDERQRIVNEVRMKKVVRVPFGFQS